jgi:hypothetical protein
VTSDFVKSVLRVLVVVVNNLTVKCVVEETLCAERYSCGATTIMWRGRHSVWLVPTFRLGVVQSWRFTFWYIGFPLLECGPTGPLRQGLWSGRILTNKLQPSHGSGSTEVGV